MWHLVVATESEARTVSKWAVRIILECFLVDFVKCRNCQFILSDVFRLKMRQNGSWTAAMQDLRVTCTRTWVLYRVQRAKLREVRKIYVLIKFSLFKWINLWTSRYPVPRSFAFHLSQTSQQRSWRYSNRVNDLFTPIKSRSESEKDQRKFWLPLSLGVNRPELFKKFPSMNKIQRILESS